MVKTTLAIEGVTCDHCVHHVTEALEGVNGVKSAKVSLKKKTAVVKFDASVKLSELSEAVAQAGYKVLAE